MAQTSDPDRILSADARPATVTDVGAGEGPNIPLEIRERYDIEKGDTIWFDPGRGDDNEIVLVLSG